MPILPIRARTATDPKEAASKEDLVSAVAIEEILARIVRMDRPEVLHALQDLPCGFELDFSEQYLESLPIERLRHILLAASLQSYASPPVESPQEPSD
jgi:hypothetical protein